MIYLHEDDPCTPTIIQEILESLRYHFTFSVEGLSSHISAVIYRTLIDEPPADHVTLLQQRIAISTTQQLPRMIGVWTLQYYMAALTPASEAELSLRFAHSAVYFGNIIAKYALTEYKTPLLVAPPNTPNLDDCVTYAVTNSQVDHKIVTWAVKKGIRIKSVVAPDIRAN